MVFASCAFLPATRACLGYVRKWHPSCLLSLGCKTTCTVLTRLWTDWLVGVVTSILMSSAITGEKWECGSALCSILAHTINSNHLPCHSGKVNSMTEANLKIFCHLCKAGESAVPNDRLLAVCTDVLGVCLSGDVEITQLYWVWIANLLEEGH